MDDSPSQEAAGGSWGEQQGLWEGASRWGCFTQTEPEASEDPSRGLGGRLERVGVTTEGARSELLEGGERERGAVHPAHCRGQFLGSPSVLASGPGGVRLSGSQRGSPVPWCTLQAAWLWLCGFGLSMFVGCLWYKLVVTSGDGPGFEAAFPRSVLILWFKL